MWRGHLEGERERLWSKHHCCSHPRSGTGYAMHTGFWWFWPQAPSACNFLKVPREDHPAGLSQTTESRDTIINRFNPLNFGMISHEIIGPGLQALGFIILLTTIRGGSDIVIGELNEIIRKMSARTLPLNISPGGLPCCSKSHQEQITSGWQVISFKIGTLWYRTGGEYLKSNQLAPTLRWRGFLMSEDSPRGMRFLVPTKTEGARETFKNKGHCGIRQRLESRDKNGKKDIFTYIFIQFLHFTCGW